MAKGIIGEVFTFTALFLDTDGTPLTLISTPVIEVFYFDDVGAKINVVPTATPMNPVTPPETGRHTFAYTIDSGLDVRWQLYGVMRGIHPVSGDTLVVTQEVDLFTADAPALGSGVTANFVEPGTC